MTDLLQHMNAEQVEAITTGNGPVIVIAGPGSGKTRVLTHRIAYLISEHHVSPYRIMAVTFTNKAAGEMTERVERLIGEPGRSVTLGTFHAICMRILRRETDYTSFNRDFVIYDARDQKELLKQILKDLRLNAQDASPNKLLNAISGAKNELIRPANMVVNNYDAEILQRVYTEYDLRLKHANARDFDDLLTHTVWMFRRYPEEVLARYHRYFTHILVDEFQDTNMVQYELIKQLGGDTRNLFVVGDPDQSIYGFRGADYRNVKRFKDEFSPHTVTLRQNYRSHQYILDAAMAVIRQNDDHFRRDLFSERKEGDKIIIHEAYNEREEAQYIIDVMQTAAANGTYTLSDFAIIYRLNAQSRIFEDAFIHAGIPYVLVGAVRFYGRKEVKDALAFLRVINNPLDIVSLTRIINVPTRGIGAKTVAQFLAWADTLTGGIWEAMQLLVRDEPSPLSGRGRNALTSFANMIIDWRKMLDDSTLLEILDAVLDATQYIEYIRRDATNTTREENLEEFRRVVYEKSHLPLTEFLNEIALVSEADNLGEIPEAPTLLTFHSAKGLEFPVVFLVGMEEGILPHKRSLEDPKELSEERRLMYVGLTRAEDQVHLIYTFRRMSMSWGQQDVAMVSRFLYDIPPEITTRGQTVEQPKPGHPYHVPQWDTTWKTARRRHDDAPKPVETTLKRGQKVRHKIFGEGIVIGSTGSGGQEVTTVLFKTEGEKRLDASYLEVLE